MDTNSESDADGKEKNESANPDANARPQLSKDESPEVKLFREKVESYLHEARAGAKLLKLSPSLSEAVKKSQQIKELYVHLPDTPPELNNAKEISGGLFLIQFHFETAPVYVKLFIESFRYKNAAHTEDLFKQIRKVADDITDVANAVASKMNTIPKEK